MNKQKIGYSILIISAIAAVAGIFLFVDPVIQNEDYHIFSDEKTFLGVPNFWNVVSNIPFLLVGLIGLINLKAIQGARMMYAVMLIGVILIAFGSAYYHLEPNNSTLVWDRLPMTIVFMSLFGIVISEFISLKIGRLLFVPLLSLGLLSIAYWVFSNSGDLRLYILVQFYPMIAIPFILIFFDSKYDRTSAYWMLFLFYVLAKIMEYFDSEIYETLVVISGHSLKHFAAAIGLYILIDSYRKRKLLVG